MNTDDTKLSFSDDAPIGNKCLEMPQPTHVAWPRAEAPVLEKKPGAGGTKKPPAPFYRQFESRKAVRVSRRGA